MDQFSAWLGRLDIDATTILLSIALLIGAWILVVAMRRLLQSWLGRLGGLIHVPDATALAVTRLVTGALWLVTLMLVLGLWGVSVGGLWTVLVSAIAVVGVGFVANWAMVSNFTASIFIAVWRPFQLGDMVEVIPENLKGRLVGRNMMFVVLREESGAEVHIPNNLFFQKMTRVVAAGREPQAIAPKGSSNPVI